MIATSLWILLVHLAPSLTQSYFKLQLFLNAVANSIAIMDGVTSFCVALALRSPIEIARYCMAIFSMHKYGRLDASVALVVKSNCLNSQGTESIRSIYCDPLQICYSLIKQCPRARVLMRNIVKYGALLYVITVNWCSHTQVWNKSQWIFQRTFVE